MLTADGMAVIRPTGSWAVPRVPAGDPAAAMSANGSPFDRARIPAVWPAIGRRSAVGDVSQALGASRGGILVTGQSGTGKTYLTTQAVNQVRGEALVVVLRGSSSLAKSPYGALNILLSDLDPSYLVHPVLVLSGLMRLLRERAEGRKIYLLIDNASEMDELAAVTIAQLARNGVARLVLTCTDPNRLSGEISRLCNDGFLTRIDLKPLSFRESVRWLEATTNAKFSHSAAYDLWAVTGGNPHHLKLLTAELAEIGALEARDGVWVLTGTHEDHGRAITDLVTTRLGRMGDGERKVLEILSLAETVPLESLLRLATAEDVDSLEERGVLVVEDSLPRRVRIQSRLVAEIVRENVPPGRSNQLRELVLSVTDSPLQQPSLILSFAAWALDCGAELEPDVALEAATLANRRLDARMALRFVKAIPGYGLKPAAVVEEVRALLTLGDARGAGQSLSLYGANRIDEPSPSEWVHLRLAESSVLLAGTDTGDRAGAVLAQVRARLTGSGAQMDNVVPGTETALPDAALPDATLLREELALAEAEAASYSGCYGDVARTLEELLGDAESHSAEFRLLAGSWLCEAWALIGREREGAELAERLFADGIQSGITEAAVRCAKPRLRFAYLLAGRWSEAAELLRTEEEGPAALDRLHRVTELPQAFLACMQGRGQDALELLVPAISQLRVQDTDGLLHVSCAAAAYASMLQGEPEQAASYLKEANYEPRRAPWKLSQFRQYFAALAVAMLEGTQPAVDELLRLAEVDHESGAVGFELFCLSSTVRLGSDSLAQRLLDRALECQGPFAELCVLYARGVLEGDPELYLAASALAEQMHNERFAFDAAEAVLRMDQSLLDRSQIRRARHIADSCRQRLRTPQQGDHDKLPLTARELEIAALAANRESNKAIAAKLHVSVRTVEGHLYQIFGKLKIAERSELRFVLGNVWTGSS